MTYGKPYIVACLLSILLSHRDITKTNVGAFNGRLLTVQSQVKGVPQLGNCQGLPFSDSIFDRLEM